MKRTLVSLSACLLATVVGAADEPACTKKSLGEGLKLSEATSIASILATPAEYAGKSVQVAGKVEAVCEMRGCWLQLATEAGEELKVKVEDGVIVFPMASKGKPAVAEGVVETAVVSREEYLAAKLHIEHEGGPKVDESELGPGPFVNVQLRGTGAEVCVD